MSRQASHSFILPKPSAETRRARRKQEIQSFILESSIELFGGQGFEATTVEQICERADVSRQTFYSYYPTKTHVLAALSEVSAVKTPEHLIAEACAASDDALEQLCRFIGGVADNMRDSTALERSLRRDILKYAEKFDESAAARWSYTGVALTGLIEAGQKSGALDTQHDAAFLAEMIAGTMNSIAIRWSFDEGFPYERHLRALQNFLSATLTPVGGGTAKTPAKKPAQTRVKNTPVKKIPAKKAPSKTAPVRHQATKKPR